MEFRLLGPIEVHNASGPIDLGPRKQRALLTLLALNANRTVSTDRILEDLWGPDALDKEKALWVIVSRLRSALEPERGRESSVLLTRDPGYILKVDEDGLDLTQFERAVEDARRCALDEPAAAVTACDRALGLWRGPLGGEFDQEEFVRSEAARFDELRLEAHELKAAAHIQLGDGREEVAILQRLHMEHPLRERLGELLMRALYQGGQQAEALRVMSRHRALIGEELGIDPSPDLLRLEEQILLHDPSITTAVTTAGSVPASEVTPEVSAIGANPYKGLRAFREDDAEEFFGRERLVDEILGRIEQGSGIVAVVGPSGSGKSSVVKAGVVPALRSGTVAGSEGWPIAQMVPGAHPFAEIEAALHRAAVDLPGSFPEQLLWDEAGLLHVALRLLPDNNSRFVLVIDQFEELFTLVDDEDTRRRFLALLSTAATDPHGRVQIILTLRADFYDRPLQHPEFGELVSAGLASVTRLSAEELEAAAAEPAARAGVSFAPGLLTQLVADVADQPNALPLFQFTLTELFNRRIDTVMPSSAYHELGGVSGALGRRAEDAFAGLDDQQRRAAQQLFLRLATITETETSGRRVVASELVSLELDVVVLQSVIERFGRDRLLAFDMDHATGAPTVEVAHEALLEAWGRLRSWIDDHRDDLHRLASLRSLTNEWEASYQDLDYLLRGSRLREFEDWLDHKTVALTADERDFVDRSSAHRQFEEEEESSRQQKELRRLRRLLAATAIGLAIALIAVAFAVTERGRANDRASEAEQQASVARARGLAAQAVNRAGQNPMLALIMAAEATDIANPAPTETLSALINTRQAFDSNEWSTIEPSPTVARQQLITTLTFSPDGTQLAVVGGRPARDVTGADLFDTTTGEPHGPGLPTPAALTSSYSLDGALLALGGAPGRLEVWDLASSSLMFETEVHELFVTTLTFSPDGSRLSTGDATGTVRQWDLSTWSEIGEPISIGEQVIRGLAYSPDGRRLAVVGGSQPRMTGLVPLTNGGQDGFVTIVATDSGVSQTSAPVSGIGLDVAWSRDASVLAVASTDNDDNGEVTVIDTNTGTPVEMLIDADLSGARMVEFSPDGSTLLAGGTRQLITWAADSGQITSFINADTSADKDPISLWAVRFVGGRVIVAATTELDPRQRNVGVQLWTRGLIDTLGPTVESSDTAISGVAFGGDEATLAVADRGGTVRIIDTATAIETARPIRQTHPITALTASTDPLLFAAANTQGEVWIFRTDGSIVATTKLEAGARYARFSPDSALLAIALNAEIHLLDALSPTDEHPVIKLPNEFRTDPSGNILDPITEIITGLAFSRSGEQVVVTSVSGAVFIIPVGDHDQMAVRRDLHVGGASGVAFAPDGSNFVTADAQGANVVWDATAGEPLPQRLPHPGGSEEITYMRGSDIIITAGQSGTVQLWDAGTGRTLGSTLEGHDAAIVALAASPQGILFATGARDGSLRLWDVLDPRRACALGASVVTLAQAEASLTNTPVTVCTDALAR